MLGIGCSDPEAAGGVAMGFRDQYVRARGGWADLDSPGTRPDSARVAAQPQPVIPVEPDVDTPDADLMAWERELTELLLEHARLEAALPKGATSVERARIGRSLDDVLEDIAELYELMAEDRRDCYWLYVVTNCGTTPELQEPVKDPARFPRHEVTKVQHY